MLSRQQEGHHASFIAFLAADEAEFITGGGLDGNGAPLYGDVMLVSLSKTGVAGRAAERPKRGESLPTSSCLIAGRNSPEAEPAANNGDFRS